MVVWLLLFLCYIDISSCTTVRGIPLEKSSFYVSGNPFTCLSGTDTIPFEYINDDYCDCEDGSDEPGTSACHNGVFYCPNKGYKPKYLVSSRVNDNYCDCCDGSDEWNSDIQCNDSCRELGAKAMEEFKKKQEEHSQGYDKMVEYSNEGQRKKEEYQNELKQLESDMGVVESEIESLKKAKEDAEGPEKDAKDKHREEWQQSLAAKKSAKREEDARKTFDWLDTDLDGHVTTQEIMNRPELDNDGDNEVSLEEANHYLDELESVDFKGFLERVWDVISVNKAKKEEQKLTEELNIRNEQVKDDDDGEEDSDEDSDDEEERENKDTETSDDEMPPYDESTQALIAAADSARKDLSDAESRRNELQKRKDDIQRYLGMDFGGSEQFGPLFEKCYEYTDREYTYKLCLFQKVTQQSKSGGRETSLGNWEKWEESQDKNRLWLMRYSNGEKCWNGPSRSTVVTLSCGVEEKIISAGEPNRCEYSMEFLTPAMCLERSPPHLHPHVEL